MTPTVFEQFLTQNKSRTVDLDGKRVAIFDARADVAELSGEEPEVVGVLAMTAFGPLHS